MVDVFRRGSVSVPFSDIETQKSFIRVSLGDFNKASKIGVEISD